MKKPNRRPARAHASLGDRVASKQLAKVLGTMIAASVLAIALVEARRVVEARTGAPSAGRHHHHARDAHRRGAGMAKAGRADAARRAEPPAPAVSRTDGGDRTRLR